MELKAGYKQTDVGVIPEDWEIKPLGDFSNVSSGGTPNRKELTYWNGSIPWVTTSQIDFNTIDKANEFITEDGLNNSAAKIYKSGTLLMAMYGQGKTRGKVAILGINATTNQACAAISLNNDALKEYIFLNLSGRYEEIRNLSNTGNQENLNGELIKKILIPLPPTKAEQAAIATALSDTDALISSLEKLIAKKRNIKQGAMQTLLQPKEGWEVKKLGDICELITKGTTPTSIGSNFKNEGINFIKIESLQKNGKIIQEKVAFIDFYTHNLLKRSQLKSNDILFSIAGALGRVAIVENNILPANTNQALSIIRLNNKTLYFKFVYYFLNNEKIQTHIQSISVQGAQANLSLLNIFNLQIEFPSYKEQTKIAKILSDMDAEITALETKLTKIKAIKMGMMQNLLTGNIRLI